MENPNGLHTHLGKFFYFFILLLWVCLDIGIRIICFGILNFFLVFIGHVCIRSDEVGIEFLADCFDLLYWVVLKRLEKCYLWGFGFWVGKKFDLFFWINLMGFCCFV